LLGDLRLNHLRVDLHPARRNPQPALRRAARQAEFIGARLEVAVHLDREPERELDQLIRNLCEATDPSAVFRFILFSSETRTTPSLIMNLAREKISPLFPEAALGGGTDAYFTELNRERPSSDQMDFVSFSINPQVHAFDDLSLVETVPMHGLLVKNAARFTGRPIIVSPVTLKPRFNPNATGPEPETCPGALPVDVDPRQRLPFTAAWTLGSLKALTEAGARSVTFFETVGWRGVIEAPEGNPLPALFPSSPDEVFAVYHLLHALAGWSGAEQVTLKSSQPLITEALMLKRSGRFLLLIGQSGLEPTEIEVELPDAASPESFRVLSASGDGFAPSPEASTETGRNRFNLWLRSGQIARIEGSLS
jgi:hypothetical protein